MQTILSRIRLFLASIPVFVWIAIKLRNQSRAIVADHFSLLSGPPDIGQNGEILLLQNAASWAENFVDVGANNGDWTENFLRFGNPHLKGLLYDPCASCAAHLTTRFGNNTRLQVAAVALSDYSGSTQFFESTVSSKFSSISEVNACVGSKCRQVDVTTLDIEMAARNWPRISILKIDAEGHDYFVIRGARNLLAQKRIDVLQFECNYTWNATGTHLLGPVRFLGGFGYRVMQLRMGGLFSVAFEDFSPDFGNGMWVAFHEGSAGFLAPLIKG